VSGGLDLSDCEKEKALADSLNDQFQSVKYQSEQSVVEIVNEAKPAHEYALASESKSTSPSEVLHAIKGLKFCKAPGPS
jgi:hypothetical protein